MALRFAKMATEAKDTASQRSFYFRHSEAMRLTKVYGIEEGDLVLVLCSSTLYEGNVVSKSRHFASNELLYIVFGRKMHPKTGEIIGRIKRLVAKTNEIALKAV